jgi:diguanylate cyclase (GGDEF)-like protein
LSENKALRDFEANLVAGTHPVIGLMQSAPINTLQHAISRHRLLLQEGLLLAAAMAFAVLAAYQYDIFPNAPGVPPQEYVIESDEAFALAMLLCLGLLVLSWRFLMSQRREMARRIEAEHHAHELAMQDPLTGLPNRRVFDHELKAAIAAPPSKNGAHAVLLMDLNGFKRVNDLYGHGIGDEVLINVAMRLRQAAREDDLVARLGGDEFAILARQLTGPEVATSIARRIVKELEQPIVTGPLQHHVGIGIGIALVPRDGADDVEILRKADIALYRAKDQHVSASRFFDAEMDARIRERDIIERDLPAAIENDAIEPYYQPLVDLGSKRVIGFEALARWTHPMLGSVPPERFIPIAESCGLINELTDHLLERAAATARRWPADLVLSFNISPSQLKDHTLGLRILSILGRSGLAPSRLEIELTEAALVRNLNGAQIVLGALRKAGVRIAIDDFGSGYSSLYHLRNLRFDKIKIERSFVDKMEHEPEAFALVRALLGFGHGLGLTVMAEGVEQPAQLAMLRAHGCQQAQGHLFSPPMPAADTTAFVSAYGAEGLSTGSAAVPALSTVAPAKAATQ